MARLWLMPVEFQRAGPVVWRRESAAGTPPSAQPQPASSPVERRSVTSLPSTNRSTSLPNGLAHTAPALCATIKVRPSADSAWPFGSSMPLATNGTEPSRIQASRAATGQAEQADVSPALAVDSKLIAAAAARAAAWTGTADCSARFGSGVG